MAANDESPKAGADYSLMVLAATAPGDAWLCAASVAVLFGMFSRDGSPNVRGVTEGLAKRSSFPCPLTLNGERKWRRTEVVRWAEDEHRIQSRAA